MIRPWLLASLALALLLSRTEACAQGRTYDPLREGLRASTLLESEVLMLDGLPVGGLKELLFDGHGFLHAVVIALDWRAGFPEGYLRVEHSALRLEPAERRAYLAMERETIAASEPFESLPALLQQAGSGSWPTARLLEPEVGVTELGRGPIRDLILSPGAYQLSGLLLELGGRQVFAFPLSGTWHLYSEDFTELSADAKLETTLPLHLFH